MQRRELFRLPFASTSLNKTPALEVSGGDLILSMEATLDGRTERSQLRFRRQRAFRATAEIHCTPWQVDGTFDTLCEVEDSEWLTALLSTTVPDLRSRWVMRHFIIFIDSFGCLEVVSETSELA